MGEVENEKNDGYTQPCGHKAKNHETDDPCRLIREGMACGPEYPQRRDQYKFNRQQRPVRPKGELTGKKKVDDAREQDANGDRPSRSYSNEMGVLKNMDGRFDAASSCCVGFMRLFASSFVGEPTLPSPVQHFTDTHGSSAALPTKATAHSFLDPRHVSFCGYTC